MAGALIEINISDSLFDAELKKRIAKCDDLSAPMKIIGTHMVNSVRENFVAQGRPKAWQPLSIATMFNYIGGNRAFTKKGEMRKPAQRKLAGKKILITQGMAGGLMGSIHYVADKTSVAIGTDKPHGLYGAIQQFGGPAGRGLKVIIPARPYLVVQEQDKTVILNAVKEHIKSAV